MVSIFFLLFSFISFASEVRTYGSLDRPEPFYADEFSKSAVSYEQFDWRSQNGLNWLGPIRNQSNCGACVAFSTIATLEDQLSIASGLIWKKEAFSQEALFACGRAKCSSGWFILDAAKTVEKLGVLDAACAPYTAGALGKVSTCGTYCDNQVNRTFKIKSLTHPVGASAVKEALKRGPLVTTMSVRKGFDSYAGGIFKSTINDEVLGGHAVELIGYNDIERYWIVKNSWGDLWGERGYARVSYDDAQGIGSDTYGFELNDEKEGFESPVDDQYVQGTLQIKGILGQVRLIKNNVIQKSLDCAGGCQLNTRDFSDGDYQLHTVSKSGRIITRRITILNGAPPSGMTLKAPEGFDYSYPQSGRIYFDVNFSGSIFPETMIMIIKKGSKVVFQRNFNDVYSKNRIGFNTGVLSNGTYEVFFGHQTFQKLSAFQSIKVTLNN